MRSIFALVVVFIMVFIALLPPVGIVRLDYFIESILFAEAAWFAVIFVFNNIYGQEELCQTTIQ